ncbi:MAG: polysaccharide export protein [Alphaproteobacteria bacterium]|nr:polysaccharide export protein [Alphaproteobacteria bacterium]
MAASPNYQTAAINPGAPTGTIDPNSDTYLIGPGDNLDIFVWQNPQLSVKVPVRPDGKISIPLVQDVVAVGRTPAALAHEITEKLKAFVKDPNVTVIVSSFVGPFSQQIRVIGEAAKPQALPYRANMTILDVMIEVGGLTRFAAGNRSVVIRTVDGRRYTIHARLDSLINDGDVKDNVAMRPGDIVIIPQRYF